MERQQERCVICGEDEGTPSSPDKQKGSPLLENYVKCLQQDFQGGSLGGNEESGNEGMVCDGCSCNLNSVVEYVERMKEVKIEVSKLEKTLHNKLRELKTTGKRVLFELGLIGELLGDRNKDSNLLQKEVYLMNVSEKASQFIRDTMGNLEEKRTFVKKWTCGEETAAGSFPDPERPVRITSVTSLATNANTNDGFEESEVFQVKTEPEDLSNTVPCPAPDAPVLEKVVKLEKEPIRETRRGVIHRTRVLSAELDDVTLVNVTEVNQAVEPEVIDIQDDDEEEEAEVHASVPVASEFTLPSHDNQASEKASAIKRGNTELKGKSNQDELEPHKKIRRVAEMAGNAGTEEDIFLRNNGVSEVVPLVNVAPEPQTLEPEPEVIAMEDDNNEAEFLRSVPMESESTLASHQDQASDKASTIKRSNTELKAIATEGELKPHKKIRRVAEMTGNDETAEDKFLRNWVSEVVSWLGKSKYVKPLKNRLDAIPKLSSELFHELVVAFKEANQLKLLFTDVKKKRGLHDIIERIPEVDERTLDILSEAKVDFNSLNKDKHNVLHAAIKNNRSVSVLQSLINRGANVRQVDKNGRNLIHFGVSSGCSPEVLEFLISEVEEVNAEDKIGTRPLSLLRNVNNLKRKFCLFKVLVNAGAEAKLNEKTALHEYLSCGVAKSGRDFRELFEFIASKGKNEWLNVNVNVEEYYRSKKEGFVNLNRTVLHFILKTYEIDSEALEMLCKEQVDFTKVDTYGHGCLHYAIIGRNWNPESLQIIMDKGADINGLTTIHKETLLHFAVEHFAPLETLQFLLGKGLDITAVQIKGYTALDIAIKCNYDHNYNNHPKSIKSDVLSKLFIWTFDAGVRNSRIWNNEVPMLHRAIAFGTPDVVEHMLQAKDVNPNEPDQYGQTPIWTALGRIEIPNPVEKAKLLIRYGAKICPDKNGKTVLHHSAMNGTIEALKYCVKELRINLYNKDKDGKTPLLSIMFDRPHSKFQVEKAKVLVLNGADVNAKPNPNIFIDKAKQLQTSLHLALYDDERRSPHAFEFVKFLLGKGANVNELSLGGWTAIQLAKKKSGDASLKLIKLLKEFGAVE